MVIKVAAEKEQKWKEVLWRLVTAELLLITRGCYYFFGKTTTKTQTKQKESVGNATTLSPYRRAAEDAAISHLAIAALSTTTNAVTEARSSHS